jgi:hypothetical protein
MEVANSGVRLVVVAAHPENCDARPQNVSVAAEVVSARTSFEVMSRAFLSARLPNGNVVLPNGCEAHSHFIVRHEGHIVSPTHFIVDLTHSIVDQANAIANHCLTALRQLLQT